MQLKTIDSQTSDIFFRCLHVEEPADPRAMEMRQRWHEQYKDKGLRAKLLLLDDGVIAGLCQYLPIEHSFIVGEGLMAILCMWVHGYEHYIGNVQRRGYGRFMLDQIETDARQSGFKGIAAWGMDFPQWNPVSFYEHMGYERVDQIGPQVLVWKRFADDAQPPRFMRRRKMPDLSDEKIDVTVLHNGWCSGGCDLCLQTRDAMTGIDDLATYREIDTSDRQTMLDWGEEFSVMIEGEPFRQHGPPYTADEVREAIQARWREKHNRPG